MSEAANAEHYRKLEHMYLMAPINAFYAPAICITHGQAEITIPVRADFFHAAAAVHGSVYFKLLDDAAFFAVNSLIGDFFALTASFTTYLLRPISSGTMKARGKVVYAGVRSFIAESVVVDGAGKEIARGNGNFLISKIKLTADMDIASEERRGTSPTPGNGQSISYDSLDLRWDHLSNKARSKFHSEDKSSVPSCRH